MLPQLAQELVQLRVDVLVATARPSIEAARAATTVLPIVASDLESDPVASGYVESLAHPGGNATGFMQFDYSLSAKWLDILKQVAPTVKRAGVIRDASITSGIGQFAVIQSVAGSLGIDIFPIGTGDSREVESGISKIPRSQDGGLVTTISAAANGYRKTIVGLAAQLRLPYPAAKAFLMASNAAAFSPRTP